MDTKKLIEQLLETKIKNDLKELEQYCVKLDVNYNRNIILYLLHKTYLFRCDLQGKKKKSILSYILYLYLVLTSQKLNREIICNELRINIVSLCKIERILFEKKAFINDFDIMSIRQMI